MKKKIIILGFLLFIVATTMLVLGSSKKTLPDKPNIIVIDICSLRSDHLSFNGYERPTTPNIDKFAKQSVIFDNFWTSSGWCLPNFAGMLTGTRPETNKMLIPTTSKLSASIKTIQEIFQGINYTTAGFSGSRYLTNKHGLIRGFDTFENSYVGGMTAMSFMENRGLVLSWLTGHKSANNPFFLYVTVDDLHSPYYSDDPNKYDPNYHGVLDSVPQDMRKMSDTDAGGVWFDRIYNGEKGEKVPNTPQKVIDDVAEFKKDPKNLYHLIARYDASLSWVDKLVGEVLDNIKKNGLYDNSIIVITGHQGELLGEHGLLGHVNSIYEPILRVPLIIHVPSSTEGKRVEALTERTDIPATLLDTARLLSQNKNQFTGDSLLPLINGDKTAWKKYIFASSKPTRVPNDSSPDVEELAVRNSQYKLIFYAYKSDPYELYDIKNDPAETKNLAKSQLKVFEELKGELDKYKNKFRE